MNRKSKRAKSSKKDAATVTAKKWHSEGIQHARQQNLKQALSCFKKACLNDNGSTEYKANLGKMALRLNKYSLAFQSFYQLMKAQPDRHQYKILVSLACTGLKIDKFDITVKEALLTCLKTDGIEHQNLAPLWFQNLKYDKEFKDFFKNPADNLTMSSDYISWGLKRFFTTNPEMEKWLTELRSHLLTSLTSNGDEVFLANDLALHCFLNEYVFAVTEQEKNTLQTIKTDLETGEITDKNLAAYALYHPLNSLDLSLNSINSTALNDIIQQQIIEPAEEKNYGIEIVSANKLTNETSKDVQDMYEHNPYPRWSTINTPSKPILSGAFPYLIAGCGTGRSSCQTAQILPEANITAIDLSLMSLSYAQRKAKQLDLNNIDFKQYDILELKKLNQTFDVIECSGVLHHMSDPMSGWQNLLSVLSSGGIMNIGLYSRKARDKIIKAQNHVKEQGYHATTDGIKSFRHDILSLPQDHELSDLRTRRDFYTLSSCRDLVFHCQEESYDLNDISDMLNTLGLTCLSLTPASPAIASLYRSYFPKDPHMSNLKNWNILEKERPEICVGMYQFWCMRTTETTVKNTSIEKLKQYNFFK